MKSRHRDPCVLGHLLGDLDRDWALGQKVLEKLLGLKAGLGDWPPTVAGERVVGGLIDDSTPLDASAPLVVLGDGVRETMAIVADVVLDGDLSDTKPLNRHCDSAWT